MTIIFLRSWWVWLFVFACYATFDWASIRQTRAEERLEKQLVEAKKKLVFVKNQHKTLQHIIASQDDFSWIERTLMKKLGVCPKGQTKVYFAPEKENHP